MFSKVGEYAIYSEDLATSPGPHTKGTIDVSPTRYSYAKDTLLTLSAHPAANYRFEAFEWDYGNASSTSVSWTRLSGNTMTMPAGDIWIRGVFRSTVSHAVNVVCSEGGTYSISPAGPYYDGTEITVTAIPNAAYQVKRISGSPAAFAWSGRVFKFIMSDKDETINIEFEKKPLVGGQFVPFPQAGGTVTGGDQDPMTGVVTVTATPNDRFFFVGWVDFEDGNKVLSRDPTYSFVPKAEFKMWAVFQQYLGSPDSGGTVSAQRNDATGEITLSAQEASGSFFAGWYWYSAMTQGTATAVSRDEAWTFLPDPLPVTDALVGIFQPYAASSDAGGTVSAQRNNTTGEVTLSAAAASGYDFLG